MSIYHGKQALKDELVSNAVEHRRQDHINHRRGYGEGIANGEVEIQACAIGCLATPLRPTRRTIRSIAERVIERYDGRLAFGVDDDKAYARLRRVYGIPIVVSALAESIFEANQNDRETARWPEQFARALPVGAKITAADVVRLVEKRPALGQKLYEPDGAFTDAQSVRIEKLIDWDAGFDWHREAEAVKRFLRSFA